MGTKNTVRPVTRIASSAATSVLPAPVGSTTSAFALSADSTKRVWYGRSALGRSIDKFWPQRDIWTQLEEGGGGGVFDGEPANL